MPGRWELCLPLPVFPVQAAVLYGLRHMGAAYLFLSVQVGNGAGDFENAVIGAGGKAHGVKGAAQQGGGGLRHGAKTADQGSGKGGIAVDAEAVVALLLELSGPVHPGADGGGRFLMPLGGEVLIGDRGHLDMQVQPVQQRAGDPGQILGYRAGRTGTLLYRVSVIAAGTGVHSGHYHDRAGVGEGPRHPGDGDGPVLHGLPEHLHGGAGKLGELVQKQHARQTWR